MTLLTKTVFPKSVKGGSRTTHCRAIFQSACQSYVNEHKNQAPSHQPVLKAADLQNNQHIKCMVYSHRTPSILKEIY